LSYTQFEYGAIQINNKSIEGDGKLEVSISIKNIGDRDGSEVVQLYVRDLVASTTRPIKELKGFEKLALKVGESKEVQFELTKQDLKFYNFDIDFVFEPGEFDIMIGPNSRDLKIERIEWK
jgi:beta-glucosidase